MSGYDLIIVGAGIIGAHCADRAVASGRKVAIVEADAVGGGATAASMGHLVAMDEDPAELALCRYSLQLWNAYQHRPQAEFQRCGTLWVAASEAELETVPARMVRLSAAGIPAERVDARGLRELEPALAPDLCGGMLVPSDAVVYPPRIASWLVQRCAAAGAKLFLGRSAVELHRDGVRLDHGTVLKGTVVIAAGSATSSLVPELRMYQRRGHLVVTDRHPGVLKRQVLELGYTDSAHADATDGVAFNVQPRPTGQLLIGSSRERDAVGCGINHAILRRMLQRAQRFLPASSGLQALRVWTGQRPCTIDGRPYIGAVPNRKGVWVAAGHEGLGVTHATGTAQLLFDLIDGCRPALDPAPYDPARSTA